MELCTTMPLGHEVVGAVHGGVEHRLVAQLLDRDDGVPRDVGAGEVGEERVLHDLGDVPSAGGTAPTRRAPTRSTSCRAPPGTAGW